MHRTPLLPALLPLPTKIYPAQNVHSAKAEKPHGSCVRMEVSRLEAQALALPLTCPGINYSISLRLGLLIGKIEPLTIISQGRCDK